MRRAGYVLVGISVLAWAILTPILVALQLGGPGHRNVTLAGDVPATFYLPDGDTRSYEGPGPPAVVVGHGYSGDRATMSSLSRSLAEAGYAVLAIDFAGHGANPNPSSEQDRAGDLAAGLDWLQSSNEVDGNRLAVLGHSMGAYAVLDLIAVDERPSATIVLGSGRSSVAAGREPANLLALAGESDSSTVRSGSRALADDVDGAKAVQIDGANHISILWFHDTVRETVAWLDDVFGIERPAEARRVDHRLGVVPWYFLCLPGVFAGVGMTAGKLGPRSPEGSGSVARSVALLALALFAAAPVATFAEPAGFLGEGFGDVVSYLAVAGAVLGLARIRSRPKLPPAATLARLGAVAFASLVVLFVLLAPLGPVLHRLVPTPPRLLLLGVMTPPLALFFVQLQETLRRGPLVRAMSASVAGHGLVLVALAAGSCSACSRASSGSCSRSSPVCSGSSRCSGSPLTPRGATASSSASSSPSGLRGSPR